MHVNWGLANPNDPVKLEQLSCAPCRIHSLQTRFKRTSRHHTKVNDRWARGRRVFCLLFPPGELFADLRNGSQARVFVREDLVSNSACGLSSYFVPCPSSRIYQVPTYRINQGYGMRESRGWILEGTWPVQIAWQLVLLPPTWRLFGATMKAALYVGTYLPMQVGSIVLNTYCKHRESFAGLLLKMVCSTGSGCKWVAK